MPKTEIEDFATLSVSVGELKDNLSRYLRYVEEDDARIEITRHSKVVAVLVNPKFNEAKTAGKRFLEDLDTFKAQFNYALTNEDVDAMFVRDKTPCTSLRHPEDFED